MNPMWLKIILEEPLVIGLEKADAQFLTTRTYIPGRLLRGAWAEWLKIQGLDDGQILKRVQNLRIGNFFPAVEDGELLYALPLPLTAMTCKHKPGFKSEVLPKNQGHGIVDTLLPQLAYHLLEKTGARMRVPFALKCAECNARMEPADGFYAVYQWQGKPRYVKFRSRLHVQTKVALSRLRRSSQSQMLYTVNALAAQAPAVMNRRNLKQVIFLGRVYGEYQAYQELKHSLTHMAIGALHTRGYGKVKVEEVTNLHGYPNLKERVERFNELLVQLWQDFKRLATYDDKLPDKPNALYFSVDLLSPAVFVNNGLPELVPELSINGQNLRPIWWATRPDIASGWSTAWGLPKLTNLAARMGSVYVYRWEGTLDELLPALKSLEAKGLGLRIDESYGEVLICHPFHQEVKEI